jgi:hypothetical protein
MTTSYTKIIHDNLAEIYHNLDGKNLEERLPASRNGCFFELYAFGAS